MKLRDLFCKKKTATPEQEAARALYDELSKPEYNDRSAGFYTDDLHDDMSLVHESITPFSYGPPDQGSLRVNGQ